MNYVYRNTLVLNSLVLAFVCLVISCAKSNDIAITDLQPLEMPDCFNPKQFEVVIDDVPTYNSLIEITCQGQQLPYIKFGQQTLLGNQTSVAGCTAFYTRTLTADSEAKLYIYHITVNAEGSCEKILSHKNWVLVPKLPEGYTVKFEVEYL